MKNKDEQNSIVHFRGGGQIKVKSIEKTCCKKVVCFDGSPRNLHRVIYLAGDYGYIADEQIDRITTKN